MKRQYAKDWALVVACLSPKPTIQIPSEVDRAARLECDGFGSSEALSEDMLYDWFHMWDSSEVAIAHCAGVLRDHLRSL